MNFIIVVFKHVQQVFVTNFKFEESYFDIYVINLLWYNKLVFFLY